MNKLLRLALLTLLLINFSNVANSEPVDSELVYQYVSTKNTKALKELGPGVMPILAELYVTSDDRQKVKIANIFKNLVFKSEEARKVLMEDIKTDNKDLRIAVQYALGMVSNDGSVVNALLDNMQYDKNAYFRDKAACSLAYFQAHITDEQKVKLYEGLINGLSSSNRQVRAISLQALKIHTGQTKGFFVNGTATNQSESLRKWQEWLEEYKSNL
ncbi:MAG: HEAT repeat domain-containing protein [Candidatus Dadabacteria bacterium]|nr:HEAT repeat domain-containing protein [Candidatus Dadabacteria bacterium]NIS10238.1 HEAT repeat domain-containing protein [Candidatus Dadabacteria bacterium]NIV42988.1 hypothetical protein [Candidatus Dadabacteria bacterium]NIX16613.1 hypothetical protein [Candidatus Dadabacteria bacterium]NIY23154.1 hypothetical protein [Candidatus Dadabacteria bacterium]